MFNKINFSDWGPVTVITAAVVVLAVVGGIVCAAVGDAALHRFTTLAQDLWQYAAALAGVGVARGVHLGLTNAGQHIGNAMAFGSSTGMPGDAQGVRPQSRYDEARELLAPQGGDAA